MNAARVPFFVAFAAVALWSIYLWQVPPNSTLQPDEPAGQGTTAATESAAAVEPAETVPPAPLVFRYRLTAGEPIDGPERLQVQQGDQLLIEVSSDHADELHLHGYEQHAEVPANGVAKLQIHARYAGRFEMELHKSHRVLAVLEVLPN